MAAPYTAQTRRSFCGAQKTVRLRDQSTRKYGNWWKGIICQQMKIDHSTVTESGVAIRRKLRYNNEAVAQAAENEHQLDVTFGQCHLE